MIKIIKDKRGEDIAVLKNDTHISRWVEETGELCHDRTVRERIAPLLKPGDYVIDAGANIGDHTVAYADAVGDSGRVYAFEPFSFSFACLVFNMRNLPQVKTSSYAIAGVGVSMAIFNSTPNAGASHLGDGPVVDRVACVAIDDFVFPRLNFIKLDIEGAEFMALKGAYLTIQKHRPIILCELNRGALLRYGAYPADIIRQLEREGYRMELLDPKHNIEMEQTDALFFPK